MLPGITTHANCIRFCPYLLQLKDLKEGDATPMLNLPYRMIFAIGTIDHVIIYSTQSIYPIAVVKNLHYDTINDLAWMHTNLLMVASSDGFCSFIQFNEDTIGKTLPLDSDIIPEFLRNYYQSLSEVNLQNNIDRVMAEGNIKFTKISFKSKKANPP